MRLNIGQVVAQRGFCFLWCGSAEGLDEGRKCLKAWGKEFVPKIRQFSHFLKIQNTVYSLVSFAISLVLFAISLVSFAILKA